MTFKEAERMLLDDGWQFKTAKGSHHHYKHPFKPGKVTIPKHGGDLDPVTVKSILKQAGLNK
ncbi:MAG: type II toxin-antitoxin system HicA family toxin [Oscillospiraceae bacterium]|nr:type II toxin-antitoxin system HicA family toxin [Oscillospiraceae bacterium]